jgi:nitrile hydratase beta subunit
MNGIHDMGGMQGMGPIEYENNEPVFHEPWEARVYAMNRAVAATGKLKVTTSRPPIENLTALEYLRMSYYEKWLMSLTERMVASGLVTRAEIESGRAAEGSAKSVPAFSAADVPAFMQRIPPMRKDQVAVRFQVGQHVRARNINPVTHTRLPRYVRGKAGTIERDRGVATLPDTNVYGLGEKPQHVYSVRFSARELWGEQAAPQDAVYIELWDDYLEPA